MSFHRWYKYWSRLLVPLDFVGKLIAGYCYRTEVTLAGRRVASRLRSACAHLAITTILRGSQPFWPPISMSLQSRTMSQRGLSQNCSWSAARKKNVSLLYPQVCPQCNCHPRREPFPSAPNTFHSQWHAGRVTDPVSPPTIRPF